MRSSQILFDHSDFVRCHPLDDELALLGFSSLVGFVGHFSNRPIKKSVLA
jgi:hypothetical protein